MSNRYRPTTRAWWLSAFALFFVVAIAMVGCAAASDEASTPPLTRATQAPEPTTIPIPTPTAAPTPTSVPTPTSTPVPTPTSTPVPTPTSVPPCGTRQTGPTLADHCRSVIADEMAACVIESTTYFDAAGGMVEGPIDGQQHVVWTGVVFRLDDDRRSGGNGLAEILRPNLAAQGEELSVGYIDDTAIEPGQCVDTAGPSHEFDVMPCQSFPVVTSVGSGDSDTTYVGEVSIYEEPGCTRLVFEFRTSSNTPLSLLPRQLAPQINVAASSTQTEITLPANFGPGPLDNVPLITEAAVMFEDVGTRGRRVQILHQPSQMRVRVLDGPARLVIDLVPTDPTEQHPEPIVGTNVILKGPIDPTNSGLVVGDTITIRGWLRPSTDASPYILSLAVQESADQLERHRDGLVPFLALGTRLGARDEVQATSAWSPFAVNVDTQGWFGASHAILIGEQGSNGFLGSGQIVQIADANGETHELYGLVPTQVLVDATPSSWVRQG